MAWCRRMGASAGEGRAASSWLSMRSRRRAKRASTVMVGWIERLGGVRLRRIGEQAHARFRLFQRLLALPVQADAAFVGAERGFQAQLAGFHLFDQLFQR